ncbi:choline/ethanolamine kinase family protein [Nocardioides sp.]|uniref:choline/ethanolamine kinase family protein n=1 Tax=Nocardioides sp. TaxID=35761 RepID=UPI003D0BCBD9
MHELDELLDQVPALAGRSLVEELSGGLTNRNLKVVTASGVYVVRCSQSDASLLAIDRDAEHLNTAAAAAAGVGPGVVDYRPDLGLLVIDFLEGRTLTETDFADPAVLSRAAQACRRLQAGPRFTGRFDMFERRDDYLATARAHGFALPADYTRFDPAWADVKAALAATAGPLAPCNNDLLAGNFVDDGTQIWLIDYEYSGNNDPFFEIGNTATECEFSPDQTAAYTEAYLGRASRALLARVRLQSLVSEYGWSLWGFIQAGSSPLDYDFAGWGQHRFDKAARTFTSPTFRHLLDEVQLDD